MSALPGIIGLLVFIYVRPHEFFTELRDYNFLYVFLLLALVGIAHDVVERRTRLVPTPLLPFVLAMGAWVALSLATRRPDLFVQQGIVFLVGVTLFLVIGHGVQHLAGLRRIIAVIFALGLFVAYVGADLGFRDYQCVVYNPGEKNSRAYPDGRPCEVEEPDGTPHDGTLDCIADGSPGRVYQCERAGLFGTTTVGIGRVRYLGVLMDPNELALATALIVPFAFAFVQIRASLLRLALLLVTLAIVGVEIVFTRSRGGQVGLGAVLAAYFVRKYGWKRGAIAAAVLIVPIAMMGGRSGDEAEASSLERLGCAAAGIKMLLNYPHIGVGYSQFTEHHFLTAHNAYVLAAGELGMPGMFCFGFILYLAAKIPVMVLRLEMADSPDTRALKAIAMAVLAAFIGCDAGIFFLSWTYHYVLWIHLGLVTALYAVVKRLYPSFEVTLSWKEARNVMMGYVAGLVVFTLYIRYKGAWD
jgi:hypothetical protein